MSSEHPTLRGRIREWTRGKYVIDLVDPPASHALLSPMHLPGSQLDTTAPRERGAEVTLEYRATGRSGFWHVAGR